MTARRASAFAASLTSDHDKSARELNSEKIGVSGSQSDLAAHNGEAGRSCKRQQIRRLGDEIVKRLLVEESDGGSRAPAAVILLPDCRHDDPSVAGARSFSMKPIPAREESASSQKARKACC